MEQKSIKHATKADLEAIYPLENELFIDSWGSSQYESHLLAGKPILLLKECGFVIGYLVYTVMCDECEIYKIALNRRFQGQGFAQELLERLIEEVSSDVTMVYLEVRKSNNRAQRFYRKSGFVEIGKRKKYYRNGEDAILMQLLLQ